MDTIRPYRDSDLEQWLRCRVLSFLRTAYFDDVLTDRPAHSDASVELVAVDGGTVTGLVDVTVEDGGAVIDTIAVHPDHQGLGLGTRLLEAALSRIREAGVTVLDAWTRDDPGTLGWYRSRGFTESDHYLHVYATEGEAATALEAPVDMVPVRAFLHAPVSEEEAVRAAFARVHVCRRFRLPVLPRHSARAVHDALGELLLGQDLT